MNLQYSQFITGTEFHKNRIQQMIHGNLDGLKEGEAVDNKTVIERFFGMAGAAVSSYCGDKDCFIGKYHGYRNPIGIINGKLDGSLNYNRNGCGALETEMTLMSGESKSIAFILGMKKDAEAAGIINEYENPEKKFKEELNELIKFWHGKFNAFRVQTPSKEFNTMINTWNAYNCCMTFIWSRAASFIYCGLRNGYGYRDTVQDIQGIIHLDPEMAVEKIRFMLSAQVNNGAGLPLVKFTHNPGHEDTPDDASYVKETGHPTYRADDALWLLPPVYKYIGNTYFFLEKT